LDTLHKQLTSSDRIYLDFLTTVELATKKQKLALR
jgi:hypothetical protein